MLHNGRLDRQLRIEGWDQAVLDAARIGVVGDHDLLASLYILSASALGMNHVVVLAPTLDEILVETAAKCNPAFDLVFLEGFYTHPALDDLWTGCRVIVDVSRYGLANKILLEKGFRGQIPILRGFCFEDGGEQGLKVFTYVRGREWQAIDGLISPNQLPADHFASRRRAGMPSSAKDGSVLVSERSSSAEARRSSSRLSRRSIAASCCRLRSWGTVSAARASRWSVWRSRKTRSSLLSASRSAA